MALTKPQRELAKTVASEWLERALRVDPVSPPRAEKAIAAAYELEGLRVPELLFFQSPDELLEISRPRPEAFGPEVDLVRHNEYSGSLFEGADPVRDAVQVVVRALLAPLLDLQRARQAPFFAANAMFSWVMTTGDDIAGAADTFALFETLSRLEPERFDLERFKLAKAALCAGHSLYAFEDVCFVGERPEHIVHPDLHPEATDRIVRIRYRDGREQQLDLKKR